MTRPSPIAERRFDSIRPRAWPTTTAGTPVSTKGDHDGALSDLNAAIRLDPQMRLAYENRGKLWFESARPTGQLPISTGPFGLIQKTAVLMRTLAVLEPGSSRTSSTRRSPTATQAIELDPTLSNAFFCRGSVVG